MILWYSLLFCGVSIVCSVSFVTAYNDQDYNDSTSPEKYHQSDPADRYSKAVAEFLDRYQRQQTPGQTQKDDDIQSVTIVDYSAPSPLAGRKAPFSASATDPCGDGSNQFATESGGVRWVSFPITYAIDPAGSGVDPTTVRNAVIQAFNEFETYMPGQTFSIISDFNTAEITFSWQPIDGQSGTLGITTYFFNSNLEIVAADVVLDSGESWFVSPVLSCTGMGSQEDIQNIATHELGHAVGIDHVSDPLLTMFPTAAAGETLKRSLGNGDKAGLNFLYPGQIWSQWSSLNGVLRDNTDPTVISNMDGRVEAFVVGTDSALHHKWQNTAGATTNWSPFFGLGGIIAPNSNPSVIMNSDGRLQVFVVGTDNRLYTKWQNVAGTTTNWSPYFSLGGVVKPNTSPAVAINSDGRLEVFVVGTDNALHHKWQNSAGATTNWSPFFTLGGVVKPNTSPAVAINSDGRLEAFVVGTDNALHHKWQNTAGATTNWSPYFSLGGGIAAGTSPEVARNSDGRLDAFVVGSDSGLHHRFQNTAGATTNWSPYFGLGGVLAPNTDPTVIINLDGRLEAFVIRSDNALHHKSQNTAGSNAWSAYESLNGGIDANTGPAVARNTDGRLEAFVVGTDNGLHHRWQISS